MQARQRQRHVGRNLAILLLVLVALLGLYVTLEIREGRHDSVLVRSLAHFQKNPPSTFQVGDQVLDRQHQRVGRIEQQEVVIQEGKKQNLYQVRFNQQQTEGVLEADLTTIELPFDLGQPVALLRGLELGDTADGVIEEIKQVADGQPDDWTYTARFPTLGQLDGLTQEDLIWIHQLALSEDKTGAENQQVLQEAIDRSQTYRHARLVFPSGRYLIGSQTPEQANLILGSNLELVGNDTTLVVDGTTYWLGLATGPNATDGLSHFTMAGLTFEAKDLTKGAEFKLMANHGYNWEILNNRFTMVHALSSHIFDLGGVQYVLFEGNVFEGYAPELTHETSIGDRELHNFYSEAIQLDASSDNGIWDGGLLQGLDPNYALNNMTPQLTSHVTIVNNEFLPYYDSNNNPVAYGATIGQHSSEVGPVTIYDNYFKDTLSMRFIDQIPQADRVLMKPIHFLSGGSAFDGANIME